MDEQRSQIINAMRVVGMLVRNQHTIEPVDLGIQQLQAKIWRAVDKNARAMALGIRAFHQ
jgi:hypothetical protein